MNKKNMIYILRFEWPSLYKPLSTQYLSRFKNYSAFDEHYTFKFNNSTKMTCIVRIYNVKSIS